MVTPPSQLSLEDTDVFLKKNEGARVSFQHHNMPPMVSSGYDFETTEMDTNDPSYNGITVPIIVDTTEAEGTYIENEDFTQLTDLTSTSKPLSEKNSDETGKWELFADFTNDSSVTTTELSENPENFSDYIDIIESIKNTKHLKNTNIMVTTESPTDILSDNVTIYNSGNVNTKITDNQREGTWKEREIHQSSTDTTPNDEYGEVTNKPISVDDSTHILLNNKEYDGLVTSLMSSGDSTDILPNDEELTTPQSSGISPDIILNNEEYESVVTTPTSISDESFPDVNNTNSDGQNVLLEASPVTEVVLDTIQNLFDDIGSFDLKIMTTREGLQVDAHDAVFDPSQIAKATSYEGSSYSTATRSATVTTWVDPDNRHLPSQHHANLTQSNNFESSQKSESVAKLVENTYTELHDSDIIYYPARQDSEIKLTNLYQDTTNDFLANRDTLASDVKLKDEIKTEFTSLASDYQDSGYLEREDVVTSNSDVFDNDINNILDEIPILAYNITDFGSGTQILTKNGKNKTKDSLMYEMPLADSIQLNPSVVIALSICCSIVVLLGIVSILLWLCRRHRNKSKIYLSHETVKPRAFFTKPMNPALLPSENVPDSLNMLDFQKPRAPLLLSDDKKDIYFIEQSSINGSPQLENTAVNIDDDDGFIDIPLNKFKTGRQTKVNEQDPPKYSLKYKCESDSDSGIKMWSSTGSLYTSSSSSQLNHCSVPPPPYLPSLTKETFCLSVHSLLSLSKKTEVLDV
ncbi:uncharacterized protein [Procambarus clarkii]|uniref:uncharacterized protein n=1 Tax=Procambarus clarkii TaxID=6728 RepID=UPI001E67299D|nr:uncharacterized protein LOC123765538 [Procambarus clarkii]